jgi:sulfur-carrier protein
MLTVHIKYFASIREATGVISETLETNTTTLAGLRDELAAREGAWGAALERGRVVRMALGQIMSDESALLRDGSEVAFFPPVTGG